MKSTFNASNKTILNQPTKVSFQQSTSSSVNQSIEQIDAELARLRGTLASPIAAALPDKGQRIKDKIAKLEQTRNQSLTQSNSQPSNQPDDQQKNESNNQSTRSQTVKQTVVQTNPSTSSNHLDTHVPAPPRPTNEAINAHVLDEDDEYALRRASRMANRSNNQSNNPSGRTRRSHEVISQPINQSEDALASLLSSLSLADQAIDQTMNQSINQSVDQSTNPDWVDQSIKTKLFPHQLTALQWMLKRESLINQSTDRPISQVGKRSTKQSTNQPNTQSNQWSPPGGILADDCGLGKTLTVIALIATNSATSKSDQSINQSNDQSNNQSQATMIVCPRGLINQWKHEISIHTNNEWNVVDYQTIKQSIKQLNKQSGRQSSGTSTEQSIRDQLINADVIIINYEALAIEAKNMIKQSDEESSNQSNNQSNNQSILFSLKYRRVVLDEAHRIRNQSINQSKAVCLIDCLFRWCCTATPIMNSIEDLFSFFIFLKYSPYDQKAFWKQSKDQSKDIESNSQSIKQSSSEATMIEKISTVLRSIMIRRTKHDKVSITQSNNQSNNQSDDPDDLSASMSNLSINRSTEPVYRPLIQMVDRTIKIHMINQSNWESTFYSTFSTLCKQRARAINQSNQSNNQYALILAMLVRLRQAADHLCLTFNRKIKEETIEQSVNQSIDRLHNQSNNQSINQSNNHSDEQMLIQSDPVFAAIRSAAKTIGLNLPIDHEGQFTDDIFDESINQSNKQSNKQSSDQSIKRSVDQSNNPSINQSIKQPTQLTQKSNEQTSAPKQPNTDATSTNPSIETFVDPSLFDQPSNQSNHANNQAISQPTSQPNNQPVTQSGQVTRRIPKKATNSTPAYTIKPAPQPNNQIIKPASNNQSNNQTPQIPSTYYDFLIESGKMKMILQIINDIGIQPIDQSIKQSNNQSDKLPDKLVIFSQFTQYLDLIAYVLEHPKQSNNQSINQSTNQTNNQLIKYLYARFDGRQTSIEQASNLSEFQSNNECQIMLVSLTAGGTGLNLSVANHLIISDLWFNPAVEIQCMDRCHRLSSLRPVFVHRLCMLNTVEIDLLDMQTRKQKVSDLALGSNNQSKQSKKRTSTNAGDESSDDEENPVNAKLTMDALKKLFGIEK